MNDNHLNNLYQQYRDLVAEPICGSDLKGTLNMKLNRANFNRAFDSLVTALKPGSNFAKFVNYPENYNVYRI